MSSLLYLTDTNKSPYNGYNHALCLTAKSEFTRTSFEGYWPSIDIRCVLAFFQQLYVNAVVLLQIYANNLHREEALNSVQAHDFHHRRQEALATTHVESQARRIDSTSHLHPIKDFMLVLGKGHLSKGDQTRRKWVHQIQKEKRGLDFARKKEKALKEKEQIKAANRQKNLARMCVTQDAILFRNARHA